MRSTTSTKIIKAISTIFARFGVPNSLRTDNGPQFTSEEFATFLAEYSVEHCRTTPLWPQANGEVERQNRTQLKALRIAQVEGKSWETEMNKFLMAYRSTPQTSTGASPYFLMFGREMRTKLPDLKREVQTTDAEVREKVWENKIKGTKYADEKRRAKNSGIESGDQVLLKIQKTNKLSPNVHPDPLVIVKKDEGEVIQRSNQGVEIKRNASFARKYNTVNEDVAEEFLDEVVERTDSAADTGKDKDNSAVDKQVPIQTSISYTRPRRVTKTPHYFKDYLMT